MSLQHQTNTPIEQARRDYLSVLLKNDFRAGSEIVPVADAVGRITARPVYAAICVPLYPASAMDGIALKASLTCSAGEMTPVTLPPDQYAAVNTGDPIPTGCDAVVMMENVIYQEDGTIRLLAPAVPRQHIRQIGEDICAGEMLLPSYMKITPSAIGAMIAGGVTEAAVLKKPVVGMIETGGVIRESNTAIFSALLKEWDAVPVNYPVVTAQKEDIEASVKKALSECDMILLITGSSAGREDLAKEVIETVGRILYHGIAIKPGKPAILGYQSAKPILAVPGHPVSGIIVLENLLRPLVDAWYGRHSLPGGICEAILSKNVISDAQYREYVRVHMGKVGDKIMAFPLGRGSGVVTSFMKADGILEIPRGTEGCSAGDTVRIRLLKPEADLSRTLVAIGSHDPLLDELADLLHRADTSLYMSSSHVGSMGGIMAVRRGETHVAGIHLLNEKDGSYNTSFIRKYFPKGGVRLVECVKRSQGLMLQKGNPKNIRNLKDLLLPDLRYVNRQKGSGTRILVDYLCKREGIDTSRICGYDREEFTHTSVAAQIASDTADAGMGIYSASLLYDLDFLPICTEQYDLLIPDAVWDTPIVQELIAILRSDDFRKRIEALGGYELDRPGRVR